MPDTGLEGPTSPSKSSGWQQAFREAGPYLSLGMQLAATMALCTLGGYFLDRWLETTPWLTIAGAIFGMVSVFVYLVRVSRDLSRKNKEPRDRAD